MDKNRVAGVMESVFVECHGLREAGQAEYALTDDAFGNFDRLAAELGLPRELVLWVYARKHVDGIASWIKGHRSQRGAVQGRINDLIVYLCLLRAMIEED